MSIIVEHLTKRHQGKEVLKDISFTVNDGEFVTLLAPTGAGKTSLLRAIAGVDVPDCGRVLYDGQDVTRTPVQQRSIAMVYQWFVNYPSMTVYENIASPLRCRRPRSAAADIDRTVRATAIRLRLESQLTKLPAELSGGQQQRLALARALAKGADYIFLDEPLTNLDYKLQEELRADLKAIFAERGRGAAIYATPHPVEALSLATSVGFLDQGRMLQYGPVDEVYLRPATVEVGRYFSHPSMNILPARRVSTDGSVVLVISETLRLPAGPLAKALDREDYLVGIRAHALSLHRSDPGQITVPATIELAEVVGSDTELHLDHSGVALVLWQQGIGHYQMGQAVTLHVDPRRFFVFDGANGALVGRTTEEA